MKNILLCGSNSSLGNYIGKKFIKLNNTVINFARGKNKYKQCNFNSVNFNNQLTIEKKLLYLKKKYNSINAIIFCIGNSKKNYTELPLMKDFNQSLSDNFLTFVNFLNAYKKVHDLKNANFVVISSIAGLKKINAPITYSLAKNSLNFYCQFLAKEFAKKKFKINLISPGNILMNDNNWSKKIRKNKSGVYKYINQSVPTNKFCNPDEIFEICNLLISNNNFLGSNIVIDGGQTL